MSSTQIDIHIHKYTDTKQRTHKYISTDVSQAAGRVFPGGGDLMCHTARHMVERSKYANKEIELFFMF